MREKKTTGIKRAKCYDYLIKLASAVFYMKAER